MSLLGSQGQYVQMACSRYGSRVLEAVWNSATVPQRQSIAKELGKIYRNVLVLLKLSCHPRMGLLTSSLVSIDFIVLGVVASI